MKIEPQNVLVVGDDLIDDIYGMIAFDMFTGQRDRGEHNFMFECELLKPQVIMYIFSLAFQMAGAMILIIKYFKNAKDTLLKEYFYGNVSVEQYEDAQDEVELKKGKLQGNKRLFTYCPETEFLPQSIPAHGLWANHLE